MGKKTIKKNYEVEERLLALILMVDNFVFESSASLPEEVRKYTFDYLNKLKKYAGIEEKKYIDWDITDIKYNVEYEFEKNN